MGGSFSEIIFCSLLSQRHNLARFFPGVIYASCAVAQVKRLTFQCPITPIKTMLESNTFLGLLMAANSRNRAQNSLHMLYFSFWSIFKRLTYRYCAWSVNDSGKKYCQCISLLANIIKICRWDIRFQKIISENLMSMSFIEGIISVVLLGRFD
jgi:hypothetical protein